MLPRVLTLQMDYHKCLRTPKVSSQDGYYARELRTNLFGIYCANEDIIHCFFYDESIGGIGPNEVISLLNYLLKSLQENTGNSITLYCGQITPQLSLKNPTFFT